MARYLLFDLDNTLYSDEVGMDRDTVKRMNEFVAGYMGMSATEARELRHERARRFGTTLEWLMTEEDFTEPERFFAFVHPEGEEYCIKPDPRLGLLLDSIALPKAIFTNSPREHADRVLRKLGVEDRFEAVYDIRFCGLKGKPHGEAFAKVCAACGAEPGETVFIDDMPRYVRGFVDIGGRGVLIDEHARHAECGLRRIHSLAELPDLLAEEAVESSQLRLF